MWETEDIRLKTTGDKGTLLVGSWAGLLTIVVKAEAIHFKMGHSPGSALKSMNKKFFVPAISCLSASTVFQWKYLAIRLKKKLFAMLMTTDM